MLKLFESILLLSHWHWNSWIPIHLSDTTHSILWKVALAIDRSHTSTHIAPSTLVAAIPSCHGRLSKTVVYYIRWTAVSIVLVGTWGLISYHVCIRFIKFLGVIHLILPRIYINNIVILLVDWLIHSVFIIVWNAWGLSLQNTRSNLLLSVVVLLKVGIVIGYVCNSTTNIGLVVTISVITCLIHGQQPTRSFVYILWDSWNLARVALLHLASLSILDVATVTSYHSCPWLEVLWAVSGWGKKICCKVHMTWWANCCSCQLYITFPLSIKLTLSLVLAV